MIPLLELAIAIQNEPDPAKRLALLDGLNRHTRDPVIAWLEADARRTLSTRFRPNHQIERQRARAMLAYIAELGAEPTIHNRDRGIATCQQHSSP